MCAITIHGVLEFKIVDGDLFIVFIVEILVPYFNLNQDNILILDNSRFHHRQDVLFCLNQNNISYKFLPSYSPQLNPIEEFFFLLN